MPIDETKCCNMHSKKREESGTCCQQVELQEKNEQDTYEYKANTKGKPDEHSDLFKKNIIFIPIVASLV